MTTGTAVAHRLKDCKSVRDMLMHPSAVEQLRRVAAGAVDPARMLRTITLSFPNNPLLPECEPMSFLGCMMTAASLGLVPNTPLGDCYLVPFRNSRLSRQWDRDVYEVTLIIGYRGFVKLARRSGGLRSIHADVATKQEWEEGLFDFDYGTNQFLRHKALHPDGEPLYAYAHAQLDDGQAFVVWPYAKVLAHRDRFSQAYQRAKNAAKDAKNAWMLEQTPWVAHERAMACKTMIRQLASRLDLSVDGESALTVDEARHLNYTGFALDARVGPGDIPEPLDETEDDEGDQTVEDAQTGEPEPEAKSARKAEPTKAQGEGKGKSKAQIPAKKKVAQRPADGPSEAKAKPARTDDKRKAKAGDDDRGLFDEDDQSKAAVPSEADQFRDLADRIIEEIQSAKDAKAVSGVLGVWDGDLQRMQERAESDYERVDEAANAAMDRHSRGG